MEEIYRDSYLDKAEMGLDSCKKNEVEVTHQSW